MGLVSWLVDCPTFSLDTRHSSPTGPAPACALSSFLLSLSLSLILYAYPSSSFISLSICLSSRLVSFPFVSSHLISSRLVSLRAYPIPSCCLFHRIFPRAICVWRIAATLRNAPTQCSDTLAIHRLQATPAVFLPIADNSKIRIPPTPVSRCFYLGSHDHFLLWCENIISDS